MPSYEYSCPIHGVFEEFHSITDKIEECPKCKEEGLPPQKVERLISAGSSFILQGSGWARDNYS